MKTFATIIALLGLCSCATAHESGVLIAQLKIPRGTSVREGMENKVCSGCGREVRFINSAGMKCEHCGARWQAEHHRDGAMTRVESDGQHVYYTAEQQAQGLDKATTPQSEGTVLLGGAILVVILLVGLVLLLALVLVPVYIALRLSGVLSRR